MPTKPKQSLSKKFFSTWSFGRFKDWKMCPLHAKLKHLDKLKERESPAMVEGTKVHEEAQLTAVGAKKRLPTSLQYFKEEFAWLRKNKSSVEVEQQLALDRRWHVTSWFESDARKEGQPMPWVRIVMDAALPDPKDHTVVHVIDHKNGKIRPEDKQQLELYAIGGFAKYEDAATISAELWYLKHGEIVKETYARSEAPNLQRAWDAKVRPMLMDRKLGPKPGRYCTFCPYRRSAGGPCKF